MKVPFSTDQGSKMGGADVGGDIGPSWSRDGGSSRPGMGFKLWTALFAPSMMLGWVVSM